MTPQELTQKQLQTISEYMGNLLEEEAQRQDDALISTQLAVCRLPRGVSYVQ